MINSSLQSAFTDSKLMNTNTIVVAVEMKPSTMMQALAEELLGELQRMAPYSGYAPVSDLEATDILKYLSTLTWMRCQACIPSGSKSYAKYRTLAKHVSVPVLAYQFLLSMGVAFDRDYSIEFKPEYSIGEEELLSPDEVLAVSNLLRSFETSGMKLVQGLPSDPYGDLDFMALCHVEDFVVGYRKAHPVYGFLASFFKQKSLNEVTGMMCRVIYGYDTDYKVQISSLCQSITGSNQ